MPICPSTPHAPRHTARLWSVVRRIWQDGRCGSLRSLARFPAGSENITGMSPGLQIGYQSAASPQVRAQKPERSTITCRPGTATLRQTRSMSGLGSTDAGHLEAVQLVVRRAGTYRACLRRASLKRESRKRAEVIQQTPSRSRVGRKDEGPSRPAGAARLASSPAEACRRHLGFRQAGRCAPAG